MTTRATDKLTSINPHDGSVIEVYRQHDDTRVDQILDAVGEAQRHWMNQSVTKRAGALEGIGRRLKGNVEALATQITAEMGKPIEEAEAEVRKCAWVCDYYAGRMGSFLAPQVVDIDAGSGQVHFEPLGVVLAIMPWNFPFWQAFRFAVPAIAAGNGVVLKHAANVSGCALALETMFGEGEVLPANLFRTLLLSSSRVGTVIEDPRIRAVTFTGSTEAGRAVAGAAGGAIKKTVLELGGSDPYLVLEDADLDLAAETCAAARLVNAGQSCIAAKRFIVAERLYEPFIDALTRHMLARQVGNPMDRLTDIGPLARADMGETLADQVRRSIAAGARLIAEARLESTGGAYYPPAVLGDVLPGMAAADEELFGPVAAVMRATDEAHMLELANANRFGLGGAVFTTDSERAARIAEGLEVGTVALNGQVVSDPRLPFGGVKESGYGRELSEFGIREFVNIKSVVTAA